MIRILQGQYRHRRLSLPNQPLVRPTTVRLRTNLFNILANYYPINKSGKFKLLDLFAGSGAVSFEALSRKVALVTANDLYTANHLRQIAHNWGIESSELIILKLHFLSAIRLLGRKKEQFDVLYLDPPYNQLDWYGSAIIDAYKRKILKKNSLIIAESSHQPSSFINFSWLKLMREQKYGTIWLTIWQVESVPLRKND